MPSQQPLDLRQRVFDALGENDRPPAKKPSFSRNRNAADTA